MQPSRNLWHIKAAHLLCSSHQLCCTTAHFGSSSWLLIPAAGYLLLQIINLLCCSLSTTCQTCCSSMCSQGSALTTAKTSLSTPHVSLLVILETTWSVSSSTLVIMSADHLFITVAQHLCWSSFAVCWICTSWSFCNFLSMSIHVDLGQSMPISRILLLKSS